MVDAGHVEPEAAVDHQRPGSEAEAIEELAAERVRPKRGHPVRILGRFVVEAADVPRDDLRCSGGKLVEMATRE